MKNIRFTKILLLSYLERKARTIDLDSDVVIIKGPNHVGKSCILKSVYQGLGGQTKKVSENWKDAHVVLAVYFKIDNIPFKSLIYGDDIYMFNPDGSLRYKAGLKSQKAVKEINVLLGTQLGDKNKPILFAPNALFMPFYIDQDCGWNESWSSFSGITSGEKAAARQFLTGVVDGNYFSKKRELSSLNIKLKEIRNELRAYIKLSIDVKSEQENINIPITVEDFKNEIGRYLNNLQSLREKQKGIIREIQSLYTQKAYYEANINQLNENISEIQKDFKYANGLDKDLITCPTCGAQYKNNMLNRHEILKDESTCKELLIQYTSKLKQLESRIETRQKDNERINGDIAKVQDDLKATKDNISLQQVIDTESSNKMTTLLSERIDQLQQSKRSMSSHKSDLESIIDKYDEGGRKKDAEESFKSCVNTYLDKLGISQNHREGIRFGGKIINAFGSYTPLSHIAYTYAYYYIMQHYNGPLMFPIVIDEPKQQGLRNEGLNKIMDFLIECKPQNGQLIISMAQDSYSAPKNTRVISLKEGERALSSDQYVEVRDEIEGLMDKIFFNPKTL